MNSTTQIITEEQDLHVFILDDQELSLEKFMEIYGSRTRSNKEYWLLDVSFVQNPEEKLENLSLDLGPIFIKKNTDSLDSDFRLEIFKTCLFCMKIPLKLNIFSLKMALSHGLRTPNEAFIH